MIPYGIVAIVSRNNLHLTKRAAQSVTQQNVPCVIILIDNASTDGTLEWTKTKMSSTFVCLARERQVSLSACWNTAMKIAFQAGSDRVLIMNNDAEIRGDTVKLLNGYMDHFLGPLLVSAVGVSDRERLGETGDRDVGYLLNASTPHPDFSCFLINKECWYVVGEFDEVYYPAFCEDCDYHVRMHRAGVRAVCVDLPYYHGASMTIKNAQPGEREMIQRRADVNREIFRKKYGCLPGTQEYQDIFSTISTESNH